MKHFVGIDLGTTNSAICSYDGSTTRIWKSPEQNDVTPSAIYIDSRGNKLVGSRAYNNAPRFEKSTAILFKRLMGTSTPINLPDVNLTKTPEECSSEILKVLFGYLPEEIRNDPETGTVITVPAAFNQMQKAATMQAAEMAGIGKVALMQEPVAAVMTVMRSCKFNGKFLIYDMGGGTLDIAIAESIGSRVNLLANGGIAMCGGRDFDRKLVDNVVQPWLLETFHLPEDLNQDFRKLIRMAAWAAEQAKIELSSKEDTKITLFESDIGLKDLGGKEIYFDIPLSRKTYDQLIADHINDSLKTARDTLAQAGLVPADIERIVFIGGPTNYKPLRDKVTFELGISGSVDVNPMTAVAEGASLFAESIDWNTQNRSRKNTRGQISSGGKLKLSFKYIARTPDIKAKIVLQLGSETVSGSEFQIDSLDTGWTSGRIPLTHGATIDVPLPQMGENNFKIFVFDSFGGPISLEQDKITITRTVATVEAVPASHTIGVEVLKAHGSRHTELMPLIHLGDSLPTERRKFILKSEVSLKAGSGGALVFNLYEGEIEEPVADNRQVGQLLIRGSDFDDGVIPAGADIEFEIEMLDSGVINAAVSVPCINFTSSDKNFYSRQEGQLDFSSDSERVIEEAKELRGRADDMSMRVDDPRLEQARQKLEAAELLDSNALDTEKTQEAHEKNLEAKKLLNEVRKEHAKEIHQMELDKVTSFFQQSLRQFARPAEILAFENLTKTAQRAIDRNDKDFSRFLDELKGKNFDILWHQDWFVVERFKQMAASPRSFSDPHRFKELVNIGMRFMKSDEIDNLRSIVAQLWSIQIHEFRGEHDNLAVNIVRR